MSAPATGLEVTKGDSTILIILNGPTGEMRGTPHLRAVFGPRCERGAGTEAAVHMLAGRVLGTLGTLSAETHLENVGAYRARWQLSRGFEDLWFGLRLLKGLLSPLCESSPVQIQNKEMIRPQRHLVLRNIS